MTVVCAQMQSHYNQVSSVAMRPVAQRQPQFVSHRSWCDGATAAGEGAARTPHTVHRTSDTHHFWFDRTYQRCSNDAFFSFVLLFELWLNILRLCQRICPFDTSLSLFLFFSHSLALSRLRPTFLLCYRHRCITILLIVTTNSIKSFVNIRQH